MAPLLVAYVGCATPGEPDLSGSTSSGQGGSGGAPGAGGASSSTAGGGASGTGVGGATSSTGGEGGAGVGGASSASSASSGSSGGEGGAGGAGVGGASSTSSAGSGGAGGGASVCMPGSAVDCYDGPAGTQGVGLCKGGQKTCAADGSGYGPCQGQVTPVAEACDSAADDDCDGQANETDAGCVCAPDSIDACYSGPAGTQGVGACKAGAQTCNPQGTGYGPCVGEVTPASEACSTLEDDNCDGKVNEGCTTVTYTNDVKPIFAQHCSPCHATGGSGGANLATSYASTQLASYACAGKTKGECSLTRIQSGTMPPNKGCTGDPAQDAGKPACLTAAEQQTLQAWISAGMPQ